MAPCIHSLIRRASAPLIVFFLIATAAPCVADPYSDQGTVYITGTISDIGNQQTCDRYGCQMGSTWSLAMSFLAPNWNAPGANYSISTVLLNCFGGPPCINDYRASSDFGWGPFGFDILSIDIADGKVVDARASCGGYYIELGEANVWSYVNGFSGTTTGYAAPTPDAPTILTLASGMGVMGWLRAMSRLAG